MRKIGLTGGIGSGKSTVAKVLETMFFPVFYSDACAKQLLENHPDIRYELINLLGNDVYQNEHLNKVFLAQHIFSDQTLREQVNAIIHPRVRMAFSEWANQQDCTLVFNEAAILFESGSYKQLDATILVIAPEDLKINRVMQRDQVTEDAVRNRMHSQWDDKQKMALADFVIENDEKKPLLIQIEELISWLQCS